MLFISEGAIYWVSPKNESCPIIQIISTENECSIAAGQQTGEYRGSYSYSHKPAGCHRLNGHTHFNSIIAPSSTNPTQDSAGLCKLVKLGNIFLRVAFIILLKMSYKLLF